MINAGKYSHRIKIVRPKVSHDAEGFPTTVDEPVLEAYASVRTTSGYTLIKSGTSFEAATTNFTIRYPRKTKIDRDMVVLFDGRRYEIQYLNNVDYANVELEIQAKLVVI
jgi:SPP1 family predicted phage head-tail adaptor